MHTLAHDLRYALRMMQRNPGVTAIAVMALGLGIGANTAVFTVLNGVLLRPLPYPESDRLMLLSYAPSGGPFGPGVGVVDGDYVALQGRVQAFDGIATFNGTQVSLTGAGEPVRLPAANVTSRFFDVLRIHPAIGSRFQTGDSKQVMLGDALWRSRFHADPGIVGTAVTLDGVSYTVVGVMPAGVRFPYDAELWIPFEVHVQRGNSFVRPVVGRLKEGWSAAQAYAEFTSIMRALHPLIPGRRQPRYPAVARVMPLKELLVGDVRGSLRIFAGAVAFVLLIACANVANLLLMRAESRRQEIAVRVALGAGRWRLARQLLTESLMLGLVGGTVGILLALWGVPALVALAPEGRIPRLEEIHVDGAVLAFTLAASIATGLLFGAAPAIQAVRRSVRHELSNKIVSASGGGLRSLLVVAEVALAVILLSGAGLMVKTLWRLHQVDPGYQTKDVLALTVDLPGSVYKESRDVVAFHTRVLEKLHTVPGVAAAAAISSLPLNAMFPRGDLALESGRFPDGYAVDKLVISESYFRTMGIRLIAGRDFSSGDTADAPRVAIVSRSAAAALWPGEDPIGKRVAEDTEHKTWYAISGVVEDVRQAEIAAKPDHAVYFPYRQAPHPGWLMQMAFVTRPAAPGLQLGPSLRAAVHSVDANMPITQLTSIEDLIATTGAERTFQARLLAGFAALALVLSLIGIYGVASYAVTMRTREIGIRMALGARAGDVVRMVLGRMLLLAGTGLAVGIGGALFATRVLGKMLYEVRPDDPSTMIAVGSILAASAIAASWLPARRAARVDPLVALRWE